MALNYNFVQVLQSGKLALSERPKLKEIKRLVPDKCDRVVTILSAFGEQAHKIGREVESCGMCWEWVKIANAGSMTNQERILFRNSIQVVYAAIKNHQNVLVHCSAGLHRTGMFAYALLRQGNLTHDEALNSIKEIRQETYNALDDQYIELVKGLY